MSESFSLGIPRRSRSSCAPSLSTTIRSAPAYSRRSSHSALRTAGGLFSAPSWTGTAGQRSRISKTNGTRFSRAVARPAIPIVSGVEEAKTTSGFRSSAPATPAATVNAVNDASLSGVG